MQSLSRLNIMVHHEAAHSICDEEIKINGCELSILTVNEFLDKILDEFVCYLQLIVYLIAFLIQVPPQMCTFPLRKCTEILKMQGISYVSILCHNHGIRVN